MRAIFVNCGELAHIKVSASANYPESLLCSMFSNTNVALRQFKVVPFCQCRLPTLSNPYVISQYSI